MKSTSLVKVFGITWLVLSILMTLELTFYGPMNAGGFTFYGLLEDIVIVLMLTILPASIITALFAVFNKFLLALKVR